MLQSLTSLLGMLSGLGMFGYLSFLLLSYLASCYSGVAVLPVVVVVVGFVALCVMVAVIKLNLSNLKKSISVNMIGGLFSVGFEQFLQHANHTVNGAITPNAVRPLFNYGTVVFSIYSCIFLIFFALFKAKSVRFNLILFFLRIVVLLIAVPFLFFTGYYVDGGLTLAILFMRFFYLSYYCIRLKNPYFILYNTSVLLFVQGKCVPYVKLTHFSNYAALYGGHGYLTLGRSVVNFVEARYVTIAIRGSVYEDLSLARTVELANGDYVYIFTKEPAVSVYNFTFQPLN
ncbi:NS4 [plateatu pika coronavirus P83]|nr:NS4 [plateatu pika coronavirus P83]